MSCFPSPGARSLRWIERLLWFVAAAALGVFGFVTADARIYQSYLNRTFDDVRVHAPAPPGVSVDFADTGKTIDSGPASVVPLFAAKPYVGRLQIPRLDMSIMLLDGVDSRTLRFGIGHIPGTAWPGEPGNAAIAGHRDTFFRPLARIRRHDRITVQTPAGDYQYVVDSIRIVNPDAVEVLKDEGRPVLTLVTCYPFYFVGPAPKRFIVQASLQ